MSPSIQQFDQCVQVACLCCNMQWCFAHLCAGSEQLLVAPQITWFHNQVLVETITNTAYTCGASLRIKR